LSGEPWFLKPAVFLDTQQEVLDSLHAGRLYVNLASEININGEITGTLRSESGSTQLQPPPVAPPVETLADMELKRDVARFLTQATFGPNMAEIDALYDDVVNNFGGDRIAAYDAWIEVQKDVPYINYEFLVRAADDEEFERRQTTPTTYVRNNHPFHNNRRREWWTIALQAPDQLRQRTAFALSQIFVVSEQDATLRTRHYGLANYYGMLVKNAFRPYRRLLEDVSEHPAMGIYLSHLKNRKAYNEGGTTISPDENYAREIMQLFSIGLVKRHADGTLKLSSDGLPITTYNQDDITEMARVFTGLSFSKYHANNTGNIRNTTNFFQGNGHRYYQAPWTNPMRFFNAYHDEGQKILLGGTGDPDGDGTTIPARDNSGPADLRDALDLLSTHPTTAPFICRLLIQRFTTSNPSRGYLYRVVQAWQNANPVGDLDDVVKAILLDPEARNLDTIDQVGWGKQREPVLRFTHLLRATNAWTGLPLSDLTNRTAYAGLGTFAQSELDKFPTIDRPGAATANDPVPVDGPVRFRMGDLNSVFAQAPLNADSVFNFYLPGYTVPGPLAQAGLSAPEYMLTTETNVINQVNYHRAFTYASNINGLGSYVNNLTNSDDSRLDNIHPAYRPLFDIYNDTPGTTAEKSENLVDHLDLLLCAGNLKARYGGDPAGQNPRNAILKGVRDTSYGTAGRNRIRAAVYLITSSPEYIVQK
ncbi:MAG: DUF1800 family protein, partial [Verrucomicrobiales bacterium]|nr:DUF1800 family protein [Verrucomicrobiales bacterium]